MFNNFKNIFSNNGGLVNIASSSIVGYAALGIFWFFLAGHLGPAVYGELTYLFAIAIVIISLSTSGLQNGIIVFSSKEPKTVNSFFTLGFIVSVVVSITSFIVFSSVEISLLIIGSTFFGLYAHSILGKKQYQTFSILTVLQKSLSIFFGLIFYYLFGIEGILFGFAISYLLLSKGIYELILKRNFDLSQIRPKFKFIIHNSISESTHNFVWWSDRFLILPLFGFGFLGNYQLGIHILQMATIFPLIFYQYLVPHDAAGTVNNKIRILAILISIIISAFLFIFGPYIVENLFPDYTLSSKLIRIFSLTLIPITINLLFSSYFLGKQKPKILAISNLLLLSLQLFLVYVFGTWFGSAGLPYALLISFSAQTVFFCIIKICRK
jgi:O-antigen/teichoic acid export membrane protein